MISKHVGLLACVKVCDEDNIPMEVSRDQEPRLFSIKKAYLLLQHSAYHKTVASPYASIPIL